MWPLPLAFLSIRIHLHKVTCHHGSSIRLLQCCPKHCLTHCPPGRCSFELKCVIFKHNTVVDIVSTFTCHHVNVPMRHWCFNLCDKGLVSSGNMPLLEPIFTTIYNTIWCYYDTIYAVLCIWLHRVPLMTKSMGPFKSKCLNEIIGCLFR